MTAESEAKGKSGAESPDLFAFMDFREYLRAYFEHCRLHVPGFSMRGFTKRLSRSRSPSGAAPDSTSSLSGLLSAILKGKRGVSSAFGTRLAAALDLGAKERRYFELLLGFNQAKHQAEKHQFFLQLARFRNSKAHELSQSQYKYFSKWYFPVLMNFFDMEKGMKHPGEIARHIFPTLSPGQVQEAIDLLLELDLLRKLANGYAPIQRHLSTGQDFDGVVAWQYTTQFINLAANVMESAPKSDCKYTTMTFAVSRKGAESVRERIGAFLADLREIIDTDKDSDRVLTLNLQMFPNTRSKPATRAPALMETPT